MKLRKISEITATLQFTEFDFMQKYRESFAVSELGRIYVKNDEHKKWCRFSTSELHRRRTFIPFQPKNALFHALRTENLPANSKPYRYMTITGLSPAKNSSH